MSLRSYFKLPQRPLREGSLGITTASTNAASAALIARASDGTLRLKAVESFDGDGALSTLSRWQHGSAWRRCRTHLLLDDSQYQLLPMDAPNVPEAELSDALRWQVKDLIDYPAEDASIGSVLVPAASESMRTHQAWVVVARRDTVAGRMRSAREARIELDSIDVPELALRNLALLPSPDGACALLHVGLQRSTLVMVWKGDLCSVRRFDLTAAALLDATPEQFEALVERFAQDVQRSADAFERHFHAAALGRLWVLDEQAGLPLADALARHITLQVKPMKLADWIAIDTTRPLMDARAHIDFLPAIGAALRAQGSASTAGVPA